ncbi:MAG: GIY-YIG nuclease family protein [bacterium]|nr:GIY-YIG nuclease family protein [bacterium]
MFMDKKTILYIGKATNIRSRISSHFRSPSPQGEVFLKKATTVRYQETSSDIEALILESSLIKKHRPDFNVLWKDDKRYFFVGFTKENLPRVFITHQPALPTAENSQITIHKFQTNSKSQITNSKQKSKALADTSQKSSSFIGPFVEGGSLKRVLRILRRIFPYYTAKTHPPRMCPYCHIGLCPGPAPDKKLYKASLVKLKGVLGGKGNRILSGIKNEMAKASKHQEYEKATILRDQYQALIRIMQHSSSFSDSEEEPWVQEAELEIQRIFCTSRKISRVEAYDIANIQGKDATGSVVVFQKGVRAPSLYRKFRIRIKDTPDDTAMMKELVFRRLGHPEWPLPDLMLVDGGKGQLSSALAALAARKKELKGSATPLLSALAKGTNTLFVYSPKNLKDYSMSSLHPSLQRLLTLIRDEAHRFARVYHHTLRKKSTLE